MKYEELYHRLCARGKIRAKPSVSERHHIVPKCMGGSNDKSNLTDLTPREHFIAHQLLYKLHPHVKGILQSVTLMSSYEKYKLNGRQYEWLKTLAKTIPGPMKGRKLSKETKLKMSLASKGKPKTEEMKKNLSKAKTGTKLSEEHKSNLRGKIRSEETRQKLSAAASKRIVSDEQKAHMSKFMSQRPGIPRTEVTKQKISDARKANYVPKQWITNGLETRLIGKSDIIPDGWHKGRLAS